MALIFANVTDVRIPQGDCIRIQETIGGRIIWEKKKKGKYEIRKNGVEIDRVDIDTLQKKIGDGTAQSQYGIGAQLILTYTELYNYGDHEYEYPMNFGTFRTFEKEDGTSFNGLGLHAQYSVDVEQPYDLYAGRSYVWGEVSTRDWMNSSGTEWVKKELHEETVQSPYLTETANRHGLFDAFPVDFINALVPVKVSTRSTGVRNVSVTYDRFFVLSFEEMNVSLSTWNASLTYDNILPGAGCEGTVWEYWRQAFGDTPFQGSVNNSSDYLGIKPVGDTYNYYSPLRSNLIYRQTNGYFGMGMIYNRDVGAYPTQLEVNVHPLPACVLPAL